ncbi:MAG: hypothetical protein U9Q04_02210 [Campylobacterota bacterium]|nr:hypothetical protein [Campylobacterota bacterium]
MSNNTRIPACQKYIKRIQNEISKSIYITDRKISEYFKSNKLPLELQEEFGETEYDFIKETIEIMPRLRFIYLVTLFEAFMKEYMKDLEIDKKPLVQKWDLKNKQKDKKELEYINTSSSLLNTQFSKFIIENSTKAKIDNFGFFQELGTLRNCIIHHDGVIIKEEWIKLLENNCGKDIKVGDKIEITDKILSTLLTGAIEFMALSDSNNWKS